MNKAFDSLVSRFKSLPGLGFRGAERIALYLLVERRDAAAELIGDLEKALELLKRCPVTGNLTEGDLCPIYGDPQRDRSQVCVVEHVPDLLALERSEAYRGTYHVLHGKLSPIHGVGPEKLNLAALARRLEADAVTEIILALPGDIESEATCHYIQEEVVRTRPIQVSRIGFGLPSTRGLDYADSLTLRNALTSRKALQS